MPESTYLTLFLVGLLGGTHCIGMCGGIVSALSLGGGSVGVNVGGSVGGSAGGSAGAKISGRLGGARPALHLAYNAGRIVSYGVAGLLAGALGGASIALSGQMPARIVLFVLANLMLVALGFYLMGATRALAFTERFGQKLWRHLQPLTRRYLPVRSVAQAFPLGLLWGWLPCGLVYSALVTALTSGSAWRGAAMMLAFGLGTLPNLLLAGLLAVRLNRSIARPLVRFAAGLLVLGFGVWGLFGAFRLIVQA